MRLGREGGREGGEFSSPSLASLSSVFDNFQYAREGLGDLITSTDDVRQHQADSSHTASDVAALQF